MSPMQRAQRCRHTTDNEVDRNRCMIDALSADPRFRRVFEREAPGSDVFHSRPWFVVPQAGALVPSLTLAPVEVSIGGMQGRLFRAPTFYHRMHCEGAERHAGESVERCARRIFWSPTSRDLAAFEAAFASIDPHAWETPRDDSGLRARLHSYRREYIGIVLGGERQLFVTLFCPALPVMNIEGVTVADDGGTCVIEATQFPNGELRVRSHGSV